MNEAGLAGKRLLVVEDEYLVASYLASELEDAGAEVVGPAGSVKDALALVNHEDGRLDGAVLDVNLRGERIFPVAEALTAQGVPFVFTTGYGSGSIPQDYAGVPRCEKPIDKTQLFRLLAGKKG